MHLTTASVPRIATVGLILLFGAAVAACDNSSTGPEGQANLTVRFGTDGSSSQTSASQTAAASSRSTLTVEGTNGVLTIEDVRMVVDELELEGAEGACEVSDDDGDCADFEVPRFFLTLPLDGSAVSVDTESVPLGTYKELEFEVEDIDLDEEDEEEEDEVQILAQQIREEISDWPDEASLLVVGTFTPDGGDPVSFRTFFEAEVEVEIDLNPNLVIDEAGANRTVTVQVLPDLWFLQGDGTVMDLSQFDFDETGEVVEFDVEIENGSWEIEFDD